MAYEHVSLAGGVVFQEIPICKHSSEHGRSGIHLRHIKLSIVLYGEQAFDDESVMLKIGWTGE